MQLAGTTSKTVRAAGNGMQKAFRSIETVALPHPGRGVAGKSEKNNVSLGSKQIVCF